jgi:hypothetical protein
MIGESPAQTKGIGIDQYAETAPGPFQSCCQSCWRSHKSESSIVRYSVWYFEKDAVGPLFLAPLLRKFSRHRFVVRILAAGKSWFSTFFQPVALLGYTVADVLRVYLRIGGEQGAGTQNFWPFCARSW